MILSNQHEITYSPEFIGCTINTLAVWVCQCLARSTNVRLSLYLSAVLFVHLTVT